MNTVETVPVSGCVVNVQDAGTLNAHRCNRVAVAYVGKRLAVCREHADFRPADVAIEMRIRVLTRAIAK
jgi:hypothetical protein